MKGNAAFENVGFAYPNRETVQVLEDLSLGVLAGKTVALVGASGGGKSTTVALLLRYYDPSGGCVKLETEPLPTLNLNWLRSQMAIVSQEPVLFDRTIRKQGDYGKRQRVRIRILGLQASLLESSLSEASLSDLRLHSPI